MINIYSKSDSELGRLLSNFAHTPFVLNGLKFESVEGWWYWFVTGKKYVKLRKLHGFEAKQFGRQFERVCEVKENDLREAYLSKLTYNPDIKEMLLAYKGRFTHFYVMNGNRVEAKDTLWTAKLWEKIREEITGKP